MNAGLLVDTHVLIWLDTGAPIRPQALFQMDQASRHPSRLFTSDISLWEIGVVDRKTQAAKRPDLQGLTPAAWVDEIATRFRLHTLGISSAIAQEAADVPVVYGPGDPGDCFLIATARLHNLAVVTRDARILELASRRPDYLSAIPC